MQNKSGRGLHNLAISRYCFAEDSFNEEIYEARVRALFFPLNILFTDISVAFAVAVVFA